MIGNANHGPLASRAIASARNAYAPYSGFSVGAALLCEDGEVYCGCNIENASYGGTICAERVAASSAITAGNSTWIQIAIASPGGVYPCGICLQFLQEFSDDLIIQIVDITTAKSSTLPLSELLPHSFSKRDLTNRTE